MLKFALIGNPLIHSIGKRVYSELFKFLKLEASYEHFEIRDEEISNTVSYFKLNSYKGFNVTIPFKSKIVNFLDELESDAKVVGAVNNVCIDNNKLLGFNTDILGIKNSLKRFNVNKIENACIIGAGGSAKAALFAIKDIAKNVYVLNRSYEKAIELVNLFKGYYSSIKAFPLNSEEAMKTISKGDLIINCTPVGMYPNINSSPINNSLISNNATVIDLVYNPVNTNLISYAKSLGCRVIDGLWIYVYQLIENLKIWIGIEMDADFVRNICTKFIK
jgi:shikimate 5-dehydrogenase